MAGNVESRQERMAILKGLADKGGGNNFNFNQAKSDWSDANDRLQDALGTRGQVEERASQLQMERKKLQLEARIDIERELAEARDKLMEEERSAAASAQIANLAPDVLRLSDASAARLRYSIQRKADGASRRSKRQRSTALRPGDLSL